VVPFPVEEGDISLPEDVQTCSTAHKRVPGFFSPPSINSRELAG